MRLSAQSPKFLTAKEWIKCLLGVWQFAYEGQDIRDKNLHPATFPIALAKRLISLFTHEGELVLDPFVGSDTTLVAARDLNRNPVVCARNCLSLAPSCTPASQMPAGDTKQKSDGYKS